MSTPSRIALASLACCAAVATPVVAAQVRAPHSLATYSLKVAVSGTGSVSVTPPGFDITGPTEWASNLVLNAGSAVTLSVASADQPNFVGWSGDCLNMPVNCALTMDADRVVTAHFKDGSSPDAGPITNNPGEPLSGPGSGTGTGGKAAPAHIINLVFGATTFSFVITAEPIAGQSASGSIAVAGTAPRVQAPTSVWLQAQIITGVLERPGTQAASAVKTPKKVTRSCARLAPKKAQQKFSCDVRLAKGKWKVAMQLKRKGKVVSTSRAQVVTVS